ncbi:Peroxidasin [Portunus trituberculatus]|uniref:Peroxidasin n=1 Tax=Portunus trituberculatus TaxID=210409 RepID=A0A5B7F0X3_PORTR|nr:Peroxidasin [Portunus trituberculatus]
MRALGSEGSSSAWIRILSMVRVSARIATFLMALRECAVRRNFSQVRDSRVNEQPGLTAIHTLWMREHNRIARELQSINPRWSDELLFQEARRIVVAELQHITFNEWLPIIVGRNFMDSFGIKVLNRGYSFDYNANLNPNMNNEFSTAAFRFGHSLVQGTLRMFSEAGGVSTIQLRNHFNSPHMIQNEGKLDEIVRSFAQLAIQKFDSFVTKDLSNHLFQTPATQFGMDLMSLNIHRGRDHGIATYNSIREICGLRRATNFNDLKDQMDIKARLNCMHHKS